MAALLCPEVTSYVASCVALYGQKILAHTITRDYRCSCCGRAARGQQYDFVAHTIGILIGLLEFMVLDGLTLRVPSWQWLHTIDPPRN